MLERLEEVPWDELHNAFGPADRVPEALRGLLDPDPEARDAALEMLGTCVYCLQDYFEATPHVVPFLIRLAADPATPDRYRLLEFLADLIGSRSVDPVEDQEAADLEEAAHRREIEAMAYATVLIEQGQGLRWDCLRAIWAGADALMVLVGDDDSRVRTATGLVLALLVKEGIRVLPGDAPGRIAGRLRDAIARERDPLVRFAYVMALGAAASRHPEARGWLGEIENGAELGDPAGLAAALRQIDLGEPFDEAASIRFVERALRFDALAFAVLPWWSGPGSAVGPVSYKEVEKGLRTRFARLADRHPDLLRLVRERAVYGSPAARANAMRLLANRRDGEGKESRGPIIRVGSDEDLIVRLAAAEVEAGRDASAAAGRALSTALEALEHSDAALRLRATGLLGSLKASDVAIRAEELAEIAGREREPSVMQVLARVLCSGLSRASMLFGLPVDAPVVPAYLHPLRTWLEAPDGPRDVSVRRSLWWRLELLAAPAPSDDLADWLVGWIEAPDLIERLDPDRVRAVAIWRSLDLPEWQIGPALSRLLRDDPDPRVRRAAVWSPGHAPSPIESLPPLDAILEALRDDPSEEVRAAAAQALAPFLMDAEHDPELAGAIVRCLAAALDDDPSRSVREEAARNLGLAAPTREEAQGVRSRQITRHAALGQSSPGNEVAVGALVRAAGRERRHDVLKAVNHSLQNVGAAVPGLIALLRSTPSPGRASVAEALKAVGKPSALVAVPVLLDALAQESDEDVRHRIADAVGGLILWADVTPWIKPLRRAVQCPDFAVRERIARGLVRSGPTAAPLAKELAECLHSENESLRCHALEALASIGHDADIALTNVMDLVRSPSIGEQLLALNAAWAINGDRPPYLVELLDGLDRLSKDPAANARSAAMRQLGAIVAGLSPDAAERDRAVALLRAGRSDRHADVRNAASRALKGIGAADDDGESVQSHP